MQKAAAKYFKAYAEPNTIQIAGLAEHSIFDDVVVVPARRESEHFPRFFESLLAASRKRDVLLILVVNATESCTEETLQDNQALIKSLERFPRLGEILAGSFLVKTEGVSVLTIDRSTAPYSLPLREGVGRARKIGGDIASFLILKEIVRSRFFYSTDADALLPDHYFNQIPNPTPASAYIFPFSHEAASTDPQIKLATKIYELFMAYYRSGLKFANSPYSFHTIGSTLAVKADAYTQVRGFPIREAGEDFYLLNKLRKVGPIRDLDSRPIILSGRLSDRVPFGTGASIRRYVTELNSGKNVLFYDPEVFWALRAVLESFESLNATRSLEAWKDLLLQDERRGPWILRIFDEWNIFSDLEKILSSTHSKASIHDELMIWFDAFRTLRFIHQLRDSFLPSIPWFEALQRAPFETTGRRLAFGRPSSERLIK